MSTIRFRLALALCVCALCALAVPSIAGASLGNDEFPGVPIPASPVKNSMHFHPGYPDNDVWDIYSIDLAEGDELQLSLNMAAGGCYDVAICYEEPGDEPPSWQHYSIALGFPKYLSYSVPTGRAGTYYVVVNNGIGEPRDGDYTLTWSKTSDPVQRLWGSDRIDTASAISRSTYPTSTAVVIASGLGYADALSASGLAGALEAPVVLWTPGYSYPGEYHMSRWPSGVTDVYVVGGESVISAQFEQGLKEDGSFTVTRIAGVSRYETAAKVAQKIAELNGGCSEAFLVSGSSFADALAVSPIAYARKMPILLSPSANLGADAAATIDSLSIDEVVVAGGEAAVSAGVQDAVEQLRSGAVVTNRWAGSSRFATAATVAASAEARGWANRDYIGLANGYGFADALSGSSWIGTHGGVLLLTGPSALNSSAAGAIPPSAQKITLLGGTAVLSATVAQQVMALLH